MKAKVIKVKDTDICPVLDVVNQVVFAEPWLKDDFWQPYPPTCYRIQGIDLKTDSLRVWATNGVVQAVYLIRKSIAGKFLSHESHVHRITILDDSGIGLEQILVPE